MSDKEDPKPEYEVGYKRPPKSTQFKKGQSGNAKGRPKGSQNMATVLQKELNTPISITENGVRKTITKRHAAVKQIVNKAASGHLQAAKIVIEQERAFATETAPAALAQSPLSSNDERVIQTMLERVLSIKGNDDEPDTK